jgi:putative ABC transport system permease protein
MLRHYLVMAVRSLVRHRLYSLINILGLSVALACAILIALFVRDQLSWDAWIPGTANLYRLEVTFQIPGQEPFALALCPFPVLTAVGEEIPQVRAVTHVLPENLTITAGNRQFRETVTVVDPNFFQVIKLPLAEGDPSRVLAQPDSIVLSQREAAKYFGGVDPVGKTLRVSGVQADECRADDLACYSRSHLLTVTGVLRNLPHNTQLVADFVMPNTSPADEMSQMDKNKDWTSADGDSGYVELAPGADPRAVLKGVQDLIDRSVDPHRLNLDEPASRLEQFDLTRFRDVHLTGGKLGDMTPSASRTMVLGFGLVAVLIVLVASFNFMNLATARATLRAREIALRKITGARHQQLVAQFLGEAVLTALISLAIALSLVEVLLPVYDGFLGEPLTIHYLTDWKALAAIVGGTVAIGLMSGLYPALVLAGFRPAAVLKGSGAGRSGSGLLRSILVVGQFAVSIGLAIAAVVVFRQVEFAHSRDWGFDRQDMVVVRGITSLPPGARERLERVLKGGPGIVGTALSTVVPFDLGAVENETVRLQGSSSPITTQWIDITPGFPELYGMRLLAGRFLSNSQGRDVSTGWSGKNVLINLEMAHRMGLTAGEAVGKAIEVMGSSMTMPMTIVGVIGNAMYYEARSPARATVYLVDPWRYLSLSVKLRADRLTAAETYIDRTLRSFAPGVALTRYFLSDSFDQLFRPDEKQGAMFAVFAGIAVLIACLGLFGLVVFTAERSTKEIGIRKVSGARTSDIVRLMLWRISVPVLLANLIAWPIAYVYLRHWLDGYAYRIPLTPVYFLAAAAAALLIAWATVCGNTLRLARTSPVRSLRYE